MVTGHVEWRDGSRAMSSTKTMTRRVGACVGGIAPSAWACRRRVARRRPRNGRGDPEPGSTKVLRRARQPTSP
jgi:hypothetical protein